MQRDYLSFSRITIIRNACVQRLRTIRIFFFFRDSLIRDLRDVHTPYIDCRNPKLQAASLRLKYLHAACACIIAADRPRVIGMHTPLIKSLSRCTNFGDFPFAGRAVPSIYGFDVSRIIIARPSGTRIEIVPNYAEKIDRNSFLREPQFQTI